MTKMNIRDFEKEYFIESGQDEPLLNLETLYKNREHFSPEDYDLLRSLSDRQPIPDRLYGMCINLGIEIHWDEDYWSHEEQDKQKMSNDWNTGQGFL